MSSIYIQLVLLLSIELILSLESPNPLLVQTTNGPVEGITIDRHCEPAYAWYGLPFAKPPINELKFKRPVSIEPWTKTFKANKKPNACVQIEHKGGGLWYTPPEIMSEDCLYLNIVRPIEISEPLPVMVYIHGGGFNYGASSNKIYDGQCLATIGNVVVVTIQYRLANLGFLYISNDTAPGNMGLLDQQLALKWIKDNIDNFGGDSNHITIFGQSAGGSSVTLQMVAPKSQGLFHRVIIQSGSANAEWTFAPHDKLLKQARILAHSVGCEGDLNNNDILFNCLQKTDAKILIEHDSDSDYPNFPPTIDGEFINDTIINLLERMNFDNFDVMAGAVHDEGDAIAIHYLLEAGVNIFRIPKNVKRDEAIKALDLIVASIIAEPNVPSTADIIDFYTETDTDGNYFKAVSRVFGDLDLDCPVNSISNILASKGANIYKYVFNHASISRPLRKLGVGVAHDEETIYHFGEPLKKNSTMKFTSIERKLSEKMIKYWTNFARTGNPNINVLEDWPNYTTNGQEYGSIELQSTIKRKYWRIKTCEYLKSIGLA